MVLAVMKEIVFLIGIVAIVFGFIAIVETIKYRHKEKKRFNELLHERVDELYKTTLVHQQDLARIKSKLRRTSAEIDLLNKQQEMTKEHTVGEE